LRRDFEPSRGRLIPDTVDNPAYISRQLGHTTTQKLFAIYSRWIDGGDDGREARKMNAAFGASEIEFDDDALIAMVRTVAPFQKERSKCPKVDRAQRRIKRP
jgi:hypothetical protein